MALPIKTHEPVTLDMLKAALPSRKNAVTEEVVDIFNKSLTEPEFQGESLLQSAITYERVISGKSSAGLKEYIYALKFCAYLISLNDNYTEAYVKTFSDRDFVKDRMMCSTSSTEYSELTSAASRYRRSKVVIDILTLSQVPLDLLFTGGRYKACAVLLDEMHNARFSKDRILAAKEFLAATKGAENLKIDIGINSTEGSATQSLMEQLTAIAAKQQRLLESGVSTLSEFGALKVVEGESKRVDE